MPGGSPTRIDLAKQQLSSHGLHLSGEAKRERSSTPKVLHTPPHIHQSSIAGTAAHIPAIHPTNSPMKADSPIEIEHQMSGTSTHGTRPSPTPKDDLVLPPPTNYYRLSPLCVWQLEIAGPTSSSSVTPLSGQTGPCFRGLGGGDAVLLPTVDVMTLPWFRPKSYPICFAP